MVVLSDCLTSKIDEGCLKVANSLTKRLKQVDKNTIVISFGRKSDDSDFYLSLNKLFLNKKLYRILNKKREILLYIPFASNTFASCLRIWILSIFSKNRIAAIFVLRFPMNMLAKWFLRLSGANVVALSKASYHFFEEIVGKRAIYLKTGIDTEKFIPVSQSKKKELREKYHLPSNKKIVLHVGHLKKGRNIDRLAEIDSEYHIVLVVSSVTESEKDNAIKEMLEKRGNITILDSYLEKIQEIYQLADVYLFPVQEHENCIDVPLSVLEAASCNLPIVTTEYGELASFKNEEGFLFINSFTQCSLNEALKKMIRQTNINNRQAILEYDWKCSVDTLQKMLKDKG